MGGVLVRAGVPACVACFVRGGVVSGAPRRPVLFTMCRCLRYFDVFDGARGFSHGFSQKSFLLVTIWWWRLDLMPPLEDLPARF